MAVETQLLHSHLSREGKAYSAYKSGTDRTGCRGAVNQHCVVTQRLFTKHQLPNYGTGTPEEVLIDRAGCGSAAAEVARAQQGQRVFAGDKRPEARRVAEDLVKRQHLRAARKLGHAQVAQRPRFSTSHCLARRTGSRVSNLHIMSIGLVTLPGCALQRRTPGHSVAR